jgi:hypothetical protein
VYFAYLAYIPYYNLAQITTGFCVFRAHGCVIWRINVHKLGVALESSAVQAHLFSEEEEPRISKIRISLRGDWIKARDIGASFFSEEIYPRVNIHI